jgi:hypothetical protein
MILFYFLKKYPHFLTLQMPKLPLHKYEKIKQFKKYKKNPFNYWSFLKKVSESNGRDTLINQITILWLRGPSVSVDRYNE